MRHCFRFLVVIMIGSLLVGCTDNLPEMNFWDEISIWEDFSLTDNKNSSQEDRFNIFDFLNNRISNIEKKEEDTSSQDNLSSGSDFIGKLFALLRRNNNEAVTNTTEDEESLIESERVIEEILNIESKVDKLYDVEEATDFSDGRAWVKMRNSSNSSMYWICIDESGEAVFQFKALPNENVAITQYKNGYSYVIYDSGIVYVLDKNGNVKSKYTPEENGNVLAYGEGYVFTSLNVSDFDNNYDVYTIYNADGKVLYDFSVYIEGKKTTGQVGAVNYCGDGIFGIGIRSAWTWPSWYYCAETNKFIEDIQGTINNRSSDGFLCVDIQYHDDVGYRGSIILLTSEGSVSTVPIETDGWNWSADISINENSLLLYWPFEHGEMTRYDIKKNVFISLDEYYCEKIDWDNYKIDTTFVDEKVALPLTGSDGSPYVALFDLNWNTVIDPIKCDKLIGFSGDRLVLTHTHDHVSEYIVYDDNGKIVFDLSSIGYTTMSAYSEGFAIVGNGRDRNDNVIGHDRRYIDKNGNILFDYILLNEDKTIEFD